METQDSTFVYVVSIVLILIKIVAGWKIFVKAGKPGWTVLIPIYGGIVFLEIIGKPWWWLLLLLIPFVNIYFYIVVLNLLSKHFAKGFGFTVGLILLPWIFLSILAFGNSVYKKI